MSETDRKITFLDIVTITMMFGMVVCLSIIAAGIWRIRTQLIQ